MAPSGWTPWKPTALLALADGTILEGSGAGAVGSAVGELCFNTAMTGYEEILTDPSYCAQIITFTFPHIGIVGTNDDDLEAIDAAVPTGVRGAVFHAPLTAPSNHRNTRPLETWLAARGIVAITGVDTRALTALIRERGMPNAVIAHDPSGAFDRDALVAEAGRWPGIDGMDLVPDVTSAARFDWDQTAWSPAEGFGRQRAPRFKVVAVDYGIKRNILRLLAEAGCAVTVVPATASAADILALAPDGVFLSNGPGDPEETARYASPTIRDIIARDVPTFGICLGHQLMALALGGRTVKMHQGHHGANHPVKDERTGRVEIVSMNHGFAVDPATLPPDAVQTHVSLFDGTNCGLSLAGRPVFSVQYHPEASPGPHDSHALFGAFVALMAEAKLARAGA